MSTRSIADGQFAWRQQPALNLHQFIAWVMLRDPLAVERVGDVAGQDQPNTYSQRDPLLRHKLLGTETSRLGASRRLEFVDAINQAKRHLRSETLQSTARQIGKDGQPYGQRVAIRALEWDSLDFNFATGGDIDRDGGIELADVRFATARVSELWPETGTIEAPEAATIQPRKLSAVDRTPR
jgi:hypothetical protein